MNFESVVAILLLLAFFLNTLALGYIQYSSRSLLKKISEEIGNSDIHEIASNAIGMSSRKRIKALNNIRKIIKVKEHRGISLQIDRFYKVQLGMYLSFGALVFTWLFGLLTH